MSIPYITIGCPTTGGGQVISGDQSFLIQGIAIACIGHKATCPKHKTVSTIVSGDPYLQVMGKSAARVNDSLSCGCKLLPKQTLVVGDNAPSSGSKVMSNDKSSINSFVRTDFFDEEIVLKTEDGEILTNVPFFITDQEGRNYQGVTDENGSCGRIKTNNKQTLDVLLGVMALEKWNGS